MKVSEMGIKTMRCAEPTTSLSDVATIMKESNISTVPVCQDGRILGIVTQRDIIARCVSAALDPATCQAKAFMTEDPVTISPDQDVEEAASIMSREKIRKLPVVDNKGKLVGIVTLNDIAMSYVENTKLLSETMRNTTTQTSHIAA
ncbi:MAG: CBS domain-containing protein [Dehalococcoidia bacterium]